jgi:hypothetical protein
MAEIAHKKAIFPVFIHKNQSIFKFPILVHFLQNKTFRFFTLQLIIMCGMLDPGKLINYSGKLRFIALFLLRRSGDGKKCKLLIAEHNKTPFFVVISWSKMFTCRHRCFGVVFLRKGKIAHGLFFPLVEKMPGEKVCFNDLKERNVFP